MGLFRDLVNIWLPKSMTGKNDTIEDSTQSCGTQCSELFEEIYADGAAEGKDDQKGVTGFAIPQLAHPVHSFFQSPTFKKLYRRNQEVSKGLVKAVRDPAAPELPRVIPVQTPSAQRV